MNHFISGETMRLLSILLLFILPCLVLANDGFGALGAGGIIIGKTDDIAMAKEVLDISYDKIKVDYEFVNESNHDITETIVFPIPPYLVGDPNPYPYYRGSLPNFNVTVNGKAVNFQTKVRAVMGYRKETDITRKLRDMGFSDYDIVMADYNIERILQDKKDILIQNGIMNPECNPEYGCDALWINHVVYEWKQTFKAHQKLKVSHVYTPLASTGISGCYYNKFDEYDGHLISSRKDTGKGYCIDSKTLDKLDIFAKDERSCLRGADIAYILRTANTWKDGIRDFNLILRTKTSDETVSTCYPKLLKQTSPTTYEVKLKNFKPKEDLSVYFGNIDKNASYHPDAKPPIFQ